MTESALAAAPDLGWTVALQAVWETYLLSPEAEDLSGSEVRPGRVSRLDRGWSTVIFGRDLSRNGPGPQYRC
jgi:hypothetical protein